jgi:hypothetical protein
MTLGSMARVFVPSTFAQLRAVVASGGVGPAPFVAHAVTDALRAALADGGEEDWEYAAGSAAAQASIGLLEEHDDPRRVVVAVDASSVLPVVSDDPTTVEVGEAVPFRRVAAVFVDDEAASADVTAAVQAWSAAQQGDPDALAAVERCLDHELGWFATQEIVDLLDG